VITAVLWIWISKDPKLFAGSGSETGLDPYPDPKLRGKQDPDPDPDPKLERKIGSGPLKIVSDPQHWTTV
jgi:hypothetical protein